MCGIAVIVAGGCRLQPELAMAMLDKIAHRGPDDEGYLGVLTDGNLTAWGGQATAAGVFAHPYPVPVAPEMPDQPLRALIATRRLAIVDLSVLAHQPLVDAQRRYVIAFNGEVYNHADLRAQLETKGVLFTSQSDTEVVLQAYIAWGAECLPMLNGDFAFVILDTQRRRYFAARDRFSIKPLYAFQTEAGFLAFASEIKQFVGLPNWSPKLHRQRVYDFLRWGKSDHTGQTMFQEVAQLPSGSYWEGNWAEALPGPHKWYTPVPRYHGGSFAEAAEQLCELLHDAIRIRTPDTVKYGTSLSGGLDSTCLAFATQADPLQTFSTRSPYQATDEGEYIDEAVMRGKFRNFQCWPTLDSALADMSEVVWHQEEPIPGSSIYAEWSVFRSAQSQGVKVMLDGHGSDEYFCGYSSFLAPYLLQVFRERGLLAFCKATTRTLKRSMLPFRTLALLLLRHSLKQRHLVWLRRISRRGSDVSPSWIDSQVLGAEPNASSYLGQPEQSVAEHVQNCLFQGRIAPQLHWADRSSMAHSIESRVPYLDHRLVEFGLGLPVEYLLKDGETKRILREAFKGIIPLKLEKRTTKLGYATPEEVWIKREAPDHMISLVQEAVLKSQGLFTQDTVVLAKDIAQSRQSFNPNFFWSVLSFAEWLEKFHVKL